MLFQAWSLKICKDCKFFENGLCKAKGDVKLVNGKITHNLAKYMREYDCGKNAVYFEKNNYKIVTVPYYFVKENKGYIAIISATILYCIAMIKYG